MYSNFFAHVDIPPQNVHILNGTAHDLEKECAEYVCALDYQHPTAPKTTHKEPTISLQLTLRKL